MFVSFVFSDCVCGEKEIQRELSACFPADQVSDLRDICIHFDYFDSPPSHDDCARHNYMLPSIHADWLGYTIGRCFYLHKIFFPHSNLSTCCYLYFYVPKVNLPSLTDCTGY